MFGTAKSSPCFHCRESNHDVGCSVSSVVTILTELHRVFAYCFCLLFLLFGNTQLVLSDQSPFECYLKAVRQRAAENKHERRPVKVVRSQPLPCYLKLSDNAYSYKRAAN
jgi:hypothetical protein